MLTVVWRLALILVVTVSTSGAELMGAPVALAWQIDPPRQPNGEPEPPLPARTLPIIAYQLAPCLPAEAEGPVADLIKAMISEDLPSAHVRAQCIGSAERIGIWSRPPSSDADTAAYNRGLRDPRVNLLAGNETFAGYIAKPFLLTMADGVWEGLPKRYNRNGDPDPDGSVHLSGFGVSLEAPDVVVSRVDGWVAVDGWFDPDFTVRITDTLSTASGRVECASATGTSVDTGIVTDILLVALAGVLGVIVVEFVDLTPDAAPQFSGGVGCQTAARFPAAIPLPGGEAATLAYTRVEVRSDGVVAAGTYAAD